jgi:PAS domain S-box-containing protein
MTETLPKTICRDILDNLPVGVYVKDRNSRYIWANKYTLELIGYSSFDELVDSYDSQHEFAKFEESSFLRDDAYVFQHQKQHVSIYKIKSRDKTIYLKTVKQPLIVKEELIGLVGLIEDITSKIDKQNMDKELVMETERVKFRHYLADMIQHQLGTPLTKLHMLAESLQGELDDVYMSKLQRNLQDLNAAIMAVEQKIISLQSFVNQTKRLHLDYVNNNAHLIVMQMLLKIGYNFTDYFDIEPCELQFKDQVDLLFLLFWNLIPVVLEHSEQAKVSIKFEEGEGFFNNIVFVLKNTDLDKESLPYLFDATDMRRQAYDPGRDFNTCKVIAAQLNGKIEADFVEGHVVIILRLPRDILS